MKKGFEDAFWGLNADVFCLQETKLQPGQLTLDLPGYEQYWCYAERKGYSGTAVFTRREPVSVSYNLGLPEHDSEGRVITLEFDEFYLVCVYTPNSQDELRRLPYRMEWEDAFREHLVSLDRKKPVLATGDMNVAHEEIDLKNPKTNHFNPGFTDEERGKMTELLAAGFTDTFRYLYPDLEGAYTWWSMRLNKRLENRGWRLDYFLISEALLPMMQSVAPSRRAASASCGSRSVGVSAVAMHRSASVARFMPNRLYPQWIKRFCNCTARRSFTSRSRRAA